MRHVGRTGRSAHLRGIIASPDKLSVSGDGHDGGGRWVILSRKHGHFGTFRAVSFFSPAKRDIRERADASQHNMPAQAVVFGRIAENLQIPSTSATERGRRENNRLIRRLAKSRPYAVALRSFVAGARKLRAYLLVGSTSTAREPSIVRVLAWRLSVYRLSECQPER